MLDLPGATFLAVTLMICMLPFHISLLFTPSPRSPFPNKINPPPFPNNNNPPFSKQLTPFPQITTTHSSQTIAFSKNPPFARQQHPPLPAQNHQLTTPAASKQPQNSSPSPLTTSSTQATTTPPPRGPLPWPRPPSQTRWRTTSTCRTARPRKSLSPGARRGIQTSLRRG